MEKIKIENPDSISILIADEHHYKYAKEICEMIESSAKARGTGIAKREPEYIKAKMKEGKLVIALQDSKLVGSCYIESWQNKKFVANSGLVVHPDYRSLGIARKIKEKAFNLSIQKFPGAKIFGITTSVPTIKINLDLGYTPAPFEKLTKDPKFWEGCMNCQNYKYLQRANYKYCLCSGMLFTPKK